MATTKKPAKSKATASKKKTEKPASKDESVEVVEKAPERVRLEVEAPEEFAKKLFNPQRPRLEEIKTLVRGLPNPREAWESLNANGFIPDEWISEQGRQFLIAKERCEHCGQTQHRRHNLDCPDRNVPPSMEIAVALAADPEGVQRCEALAREVVARTSEFGGFSPQEVGWRCSDKPQLVYINRPGDEVMAAYQGGGRVAGDAQFTDRVLNVIETAPRHYSKYWQLIHRLSVDVHRAGLFSRRKKETRANPFDPLLEIWRAGYVPEAITEDAFVLWALLPKGFLQ